MIDLCSWLILSFCIFINYLILFLFVVVVYTPCGWGQWLKDGRRLVFCSWIPHCTVYKNISLCCQKSSRLLWFPFNKMHSKLLSAHICYFLRLYKCYLLLKKSNVYTYAVPLAIIIINLYFSKKNYYEGCVVIKTSDVHWFKCNRSALWRGCFFMQNRFGV